ncbi:MAG: methylenetetrahydrofolate reductase [Desulfobacterales bacterium]|nr:methylenetetrahydrofolate reductase [Desulfobacterales bacterium]
MPTPFPSARTFTVTVEVVPPAGGTPDELMEKLKTVSHLDFDRFSVAANPVANPRMSAMAFCHCLSSHTGKPAILHLTVRDQNRLGLQAELWGAKAMGIDTVIAVTGDPAPAHRPARCAPVADLSVFELVELARNSDLSTGVVLDFRPEVNGLEAEVRRLEKKAAAGAQFIVTQPVYDLETAEVLARAMEHIPVPKLMGILPLVSERHARFLHDKVAGIAIPHALQGAMAESPSPLETGIENAREMLDTARHLFSGACVMPPFERFDILKQIL